MTKDEQKRDAAIREYLGLPPCACNRYPCPEIALNWPDGFSDREITAILDGTKPVPKQPYYVGPGTNLDPRRGPVA